MKTAFFFYDEVHQKQEISLILAHAGFKPIEFSNVSSFLQTLLYTQIKPKLIILSLSTALNTIFQLLRKLSAYNISESVPVIIAASEPQFQFFDVLSQEDCYFISTPLLSSHSLSDIIKDFSRTRTAAHELSINN